MNKKIKIRIANEDDAKLLADIGVKTFLETYSGKIDNRNLRLYTRNSFNKEKIKKEIRDMSSIFFIVFNKDVIVGYVKLNKSKNPKELKNAKAIEIERTYLLKKFRGKGIGRNLMKKCIMLAKKEGFKVIWAGIWEKNKLSIAVCKRFGFELFSSHIFKLGNLLQKDLLFKKKI